MMMAYTHKTDLMKRMLHYVSHGYTAWTAGEIPRAKAEAIALKFVDRYAVDRTEMQRYRAKALGQANSMLLMLVDTKDKAAPVKWWLLATPGKGLVHELEMLVNVRDKLPNITGYELVMMPRKRQPKDKPNKPIKPSWTWRMTTETFEGWQERLKLAVRQNLDPQLQQIIYSLGRSPGFRGIRSQAYLLWRMMRNDWRRTQRGEIPLTPPIIRYCGRYQTPVMIDLVSIGKRPKRQGAERG